MNCSSVGLQFSIISLMYLDIHVDITFGSVNDHLGVVLTLAQSVFGLCI